MNRDDEYQRWLRVDPTPQFGKWVKSEEGRYTIAGLLAAVMYIAGLLLVLASEITE